MASLFEEDKNTQTKQVNFPPVIYAKGARISTNSIFFIFLNFKFFFFDFSIIFFLRNFIPVKLFWSKQSVHVHSFFCVFFFTIIHTFQRHAVYTLNIWSDLAPNLWNIFVRCDGNEWVSFIQTGTRGLMLSNMDETNAIVERTESKLTDHMRWNRDKREPCMKNNREPHSIHSIVIEYITRERVCWCSFDTKHNIALIAGRLRRDEMLSVNR